MIQVNRIYLIFNRLVTKKFLVDTSDMRTRKVFRMPLDKILCLSANAILTIIALWSIASVFFENATIDSIIARFSVASACMANLFSKHRLIRIIFLIMAFVLIIVATTLYVHKANKM